MVEIVNKVHYEEEAVTIPIIRRVGANPNKIISSICRTRPITAVSGIHYQPMRDNLTFKINENQKFIRLTLNQKDFDREEGIVGLHLVVHSVLDLEVKPYLKTKSNLHLILALKMITNRTTLLLFIYSNK